MCDRARGVRFLCVVSDFLCGGASAARRAVRGELAVARITRTDMSTREIPRDQWVAFFDSFSREHDGWLATVEVLGSDIGAQRQAQDQPFGGISADLKDRESDVSIVIGSRAGDHVDHVVHRPRHVVLKEGAGGAHEALQIQGDDGATTLLTFRSPAPTETLDGAA
jgi:hypothetical protein